MSLTLREEHRLRVLENRVLRRIFGPKRDEVTGGWGRLHNEKLNDLYSFFFFLGATAPIWALAYLHETLRFTSVF
jgi:hypothetical protein